MAASRNHYKPLIFYDQQARSARRCCRLLNISDTILQNGRILTNHGHIVPKAAHGVNYPEQ